MKGRTLWLVGLLLLLGLAIGGLCQFAAEWLWFTEVGYTEIFGLRLATQVGLWAIASSLSAVFLLGNLALAQRLKYPYLERTSALAKTPLGGAGRRDRRTSLKPTSVQTAPTSKPITLKWLLPIVLGLVLLMSLIVWHQLQAGVNAWANDFNQPTGLPALPNRLRPDFLWTVGRQLFTLGSGSAVTDLSIGLVMASTIAVLLYPTVLLSAITSIASLSFGFILSAQWGRVLQWFHAVTFDRADPLFHHNIGFYVFTLPIAQLLAFWLVDLFLYGLLIVALVYLLSGNSLSQGVFVGFSRQQQRHLSGTGGCVMVAVCLHYWLDRYELLYSSHSAIYGAGYTDTHIRLPVYGFLSILAGAIAILLFWQAGQKAEGRRQKAEGRGQKGGEARGAGGAMQNSNFKTQNSKLKTSNSLLPTPHSPLPTPFLLLSCYLAIALLTTTVLPNAIQRLLVQPNELAREQPYISRSIALTRTAFALENIEIKTFNPQATLTFAELVANQATTRNIRLWDTRPLLETNRQLQQIRPYYRFFDADIDRYTFEEERGEERGERSKEIPRPSSSAMAQQVLIAARELDYAAVPKEAQTWINEHLVYTHGYGFTLSPVNQVAAGGLPDYYVKDIGVKAIGASTPTSDPVTGDRATNPIDVAIRASIPTENPRLYYGELANTYVMTGTRVQELDYPSGSDNVYNVYDGTGGIAIGSLWQRCLLAGYLKDWRMLLTTDFTPQTKLLFRRNINQRLRAIAPFLQYDRDPYLVVADIGQKAEGRGQEAEGRGQKAEGRRQRAEGRRQKLGNHSNKELYDQQLTTNNQQLTTPLTQNSKLKTQNYLYWMVDAYTTSDRYPYSEPSQLTSISGVETTPHGQTFNYIRNSVKIVIDAYNGAVNFYVTEPTDPIIQAWGAVFPKLLQPLNAMPAALRSHIRYPADLFGAQAAQLMTYHMIDPQVFYNREDLWQVPTEIYGNQPQLVEPYYLITKLTTGKDEEFVLLLPFTPNQRTNLTAWLAARSDGENYGKSLLYVFPKQKLVYGTEQIEALINQDPVISQQIALWNRQGSRALQGNLLVIPIEQSLLYVEPLYLEAEQNSLPTLVRVIVAYENRIAMAETLEQALKAVFQPKKTTAPAIVRPVP